MRRPKSLPNSKSAMASRDVESVWLSTHHVTRYRLNACRYILSLSHWLIYAYWLGCRLKY